LVREFEREGGEKKREKIVLKLAIKIVLFLSHFKIIKTD
jgi:hypothetical protein